VTEAEGGAGGARRRQGRRRLAGRWINEGDGDGAPNRVSVLRFGEMAAGKH
jgi:hypothetical protein